MAKAVIKDNHMNFSGKTYFRGGAEDVVLGSYGEKRTPITKMNYLEVKGQISADKFKVTKATEISINFTKSSKGDFTATAQGKLKGVDVKASAGVIYDRLRSGDVKLVKFTVLNNSMQKAANDSPNALRNLINYGNDARIAHQIFVVMSATLSKKFTTGVSFDASAEKGKVKIAAKGKTRASGTTTVTLSPGTTFAYLLLKLDWDAKLKKNKKRIVDTDDDQWGLG